METTISEDHRRDILAVFKGVIREKQFDLSVAWTGPMEMRISTQTEGFYLQFRDLHDVLTILKQCSSIEAFWGELDEMYGNK